MSRVVSAIAAVLVSSLALGPLEGLAQSRTEAIEMLTLALQCPVKPQTRPQETARESTLRSIVRYKYVGDGNVFSVIRNAESRLHRAGSNEVSSDANTMKFTIPYARLGTIVQSEESNLFLGCRTDGCVSSPATNTYYERDKLSITFCDAETATNAQAALKILRGPLTLKMWDYHGALVTRWTRKDSIGFSIYESSEWTRRRGYRTGDDLIWGSNEGAGFKGWLSLPSKVCDGYQNVDIAGPRIGAQSAEITFRGPHQSPAPECEFVPGSFSTISLGYKGEVQDGGSETGADQPTASEPPRQASPAAAPDVSGVLPGIVPRRTKTMRIEGDQP
jgi:hypothetical protein